MNGNFEFKPLDFLNFSGNKSVPLIIQSEVTECGLAAVAMVAGYYGHRINLAALRRDISVSSQGMNLKQIINLASDLGLISRALKCDLKEVKELKLPCILHWDLDHFVVLTGVNSKWVYVNDPVMGKSRLTWSEFGDHFTGVALELSPSSRFEKKNRIAVMKISQLWERIIGLKRGIGALLLLSVVLQFTAILSPYYIQWVIDNALLTNDKSLLVVLATGFSLLTITQVCLSSVRSWFILRFSSALSIQMGANLFHHLIRLPLSYFEKRHIGDVVSRFGSIHSIKDLLTTGIVEALIDGLMAIVILAMMLMYSFSITSVVILFSLLLFIIQLVFYYPNKRRTEEAIVAEAAEDSYFLESVRSIQTVKLFSHEPSRQSNWLNRYSEVINTDIKLGKLEIAESSFRKLLIGLESIVVIYLGALSVIDGKFTVGMLLAFIAYKTQFTTSISAFIDRLFSFKLMTLHLERLSDLTLESREHNVELFQSNREIKGRIRVKNLFFRYSDADDWVIEDLSLNIEHGETVAIIGSSGCGKTTLMKLMLGLVKPCSGSISLDNIDIASLPIGEYRQYFGSVMQNDSLLSGTLAENISMFESYYDESKVIDCCKKACIWDEIASLPMGLNTLVGDMGNTFSGGQLQRIYLARALYKEPKMLFLDESTSHLDYENEIAINQHLSTLTITKVIIAHRAETIKSADRVIDLSKNIE